MDKLVNIRISMSSEPLYRHAPKNERYLSKNIGEFTTFSRAVSRRMDVATFCLGR